MADLTITAASVIKGSNAKTKTGIAGAAITQGQVLALDSTGKLILCDCDHATVLTRTPVGIALNSAAASGQPIEYIYEGTLAIGATVAASVPYFASPTAGGICPLADVASGDFAKFLGFGISVTEINVHLHECTVVKA